MENASIILTSSVFAAVISAGVSALLSIVLKNKDYRNDYYKKVIDKRIKAAESLENFLHIFTTVTTIAQEEVSICTFFIQSHHSYKEKFMSEDDEFAKAVQDVSSQILWLSKNSFNYFQEFASVVSSIRYEADKLQTGEEVLRFYISNHKLIARVKASLEKSLANDMIDLYDVENFFRNRRK